MENKNSNIEPGNGNPIKKIFVKNNTVRIDTTPINKFGSTNTPDTSKSYLQKNFDMPIDTNPNINLPGKMVASASPKPYIKISGFINTYNKKGQITGELTLGTKPKKNTNPKKEPKPTQYAKLSIPSHDEEILADDITLKINTTDYFIGSKTMYDSYRENKIIQNDMLHSSLFEKIVKKFFNFVKEKELNSKIKTSFELYILPNDNQITHKDRDRDADDKTLTDALGNNGNLPSTPSKGVFFLSYDDQAFTVNCKTKQDFYEDLGISDVSLSKIILPKNKVMNIAGFNWYFLDLHTSDRTFKSRKRGIYDQLHANYTELKHGHDMAGVSSFYKIFCIKKTNAKLEVMIDENLSMHRLRTIFENVKSGDVPLLAYEIFIIKNKKGRNSIYRHYIQAIKSLLTQTRFDYTQMVRIFTEQVHNQVQDWLSDRTCKQAIEFYKKSEFCMKTLNYKKEPSMQLNNVEAFAMHVGHMAREYVDFRKKTNNDNNSLKDLLSKRKYDVNTLKFVVQSIGRGIHLLNLTKEQYDDILKKITEHTPKESKLENIRADLSYHFYMGYFGVNHDKI